MANISSPALTLPHNPKEMGPEVNTRLSFDTKITMTIKAVLFCEN